METGNIFVTIRYIDLKKRQEMSLNAVRDILHF
jgi:hypothetical protein